MDCSGVNPCLNGGSCDTDACTCAAGFNGALCSTGIEIYCNAHSVFSGLFFVFMKSDFALNHINVDLIMPFFFSIFNLCSFRDLITCLYILRLSF